MIQKDEILHTIHALPPLPVTAQRVIAWLQGSSRSDRSIAGIVQADESLSVEILRLANNPYFSAGKRFSTLAEILAVLGDERFFTLILVPATIQWFMHLDSRIQIPLCRLWEHSLAVAVGVENIPRVLGREVPACAFLSGFLHDTGKALMERVLRIDSQEIIDRAEEHNQSLDEEERAMLGVDHMEIGAILLTAWKLPDPIVSAVRGHHLPERFQDDSGLIDLVHVADAISLMMGIGLQSEGLRYRTSPVVEARLHLKIHAVEQVISLIHDNMQFFKDWLPSLAGEQQSCQ